MKEYIFAGASNRALHMYVIPLGEEFGEYGKAAGIYDINPKRAGYIGEKYNIPVYRDFDEMLKKSGAQTVIVTTVDAYHHEYIVKSLMAGYDVITEKPMTIDAEKARQILAAEKQSGKKLTVTFNYRYVSFAEKIKELLASGVIGDIYSVHFEWMLDANMDILAHGTSYFRRWNRYLLKCGGLLVHKSTHHFDLINWWLGDSPTEVAAFGELRRYGRNGAFRGKNCRSCTHTAKCEYYYDITKNPFEMAFYVDTEDEDGYYKDGCVFAEDIDSYDTMSVNVKYVKGSMLSYSLNAHCAYEGWRVAINGSKGRLEAFHPESGKLGKAKAHQIQIFDRYDSIITYDVPVKAGGHGGGDIALLKALYIGNQPDPLGKQAGSAEGLDSIIIGAAANISIREKRIVNIQDLIAGR